LGKEKLTNILKESDKEIEIVCNFCKEKYIYTKDEIEKLIKNQ
jgi:redox-regulated HSP33 family molecular chaperone